MKILIVDDDVRNSLLLKRFIETEGFEVMYAPNGMAGVAVYREWSPDLILLDVNMPEMDGFEMARIIRRSDSRVIIFFLTDRTEKSDRLLGFSLKGNDYIPKPFYPEEVVAKIRERSESLSVEQVMEYQLGDTLFRSELCTVTWRGEVHTLSVRQSEILAMLAAARGGVVSREEILNRVWGDASYANSLALNVQISYIRRLLKDPSITIISLKKKGYKLEVNQSVSGVVS